MLISRRWVNIGSSSQFAASSSPESLDSASGGATDVSCSWEPSTATATLKCLASSTRHDFPHRQHDAHDSPSRQFCDASASKKTKRRAGSQRPHTNLDVAMTRDLEIDFSTRNFAILQLVYFACNDTASDMISASAFIYKFCSFFLCLGAHYAWCLNPVTGSGIECSPGAIGFAFGHVRRHPRCLRLTSVSLSPLFLIIIFLY